MSSTFAETELAVLKSKSSVGVLAFRRVVERVVGEKVKINSLGVLRVQSGTAE